MAAEIEHCTALQIPTHKKMNRKNRAASLYEVCSAGMVKQLSVGQSGSERGTVGKRKAMRERVVRAADPKVHRRLEAPMLAKFVLRLPSGCPDAAPAGGLFAAMDAACEAKFGAAVDAPYLT
jgi:hypothetical protein